MATPLIDSLNDEAIDAYLSGDQSAPEGLRQLGAVMALHGVAENGGLVGGAIENAFFADDLGSVTDAIQGFIWLDLPDVAGLVTRARDAYLRFRPTGWDELSTDDGVLWHQLDSSYFDVATGDRLEVAVSARLPEITPGRHP